MEYKSQPHSVRAFQLTEGQLVTPEWFDKAVATNKASITIDGKKSYITIYLRDGESNRVKLNEWVCITPSDSLYRSTNEDFKRGFYDKS